MALYNSKREKSDSKTYEYSARLLVQYSDTHFLVSRVFACSFSNDNDDDDGLCQNV